MKTSIVFFVGFFLFGYVGAKPQNAVLNDIGKQISDTATSIVKFKEGTLQTIYRYILDVLPAKEAVEYYEQLKNSPQWKAVIDLIDGKDFLKILEQIQETPAYKILVDYYDKIIECYEKVLNNIL